MCHCLFWSHCFTTTAIFHYTCMCLISRWDEIAINNNCANNLMNSNIIFLTQPCMYIQLTMCPLILLKIPFHGVGAKMGIFGDTWCNTRNLFPFQWFSKCLEPFKTIPARREVEKVVWPIRYSDNLCRRDAFRELLSNSVNLTRLRMIQRWKLKIIRNFLLLNLLHLPLFNLVLVLCIAVAVSDPDLVLRGRARFFVTSPVGSSSFCGSFPSFFHPK